MCNVYYILYKIKNNKHKVARSNFPFKKPNKDNVILVKLLEEGFNRPVYWNEYKTKIESKNLDKDNLTRFPLHASFQGVRRLFFLYLTILILVIKNLKETVTQNIFFQE